jgi:choline-glycine betaine transporter
MVLSAVLVVVYPEQGLLLSALAGSTITGMLSVGARTFGPRTVGGAVVAACAAGPVLSLATHGTLTLTDTTVELSLAAVMLVAVVSLHRHLAALPRAPSATIGMNGHE